MSHFFHIEGVAAALAIIGSVYSFIRWLNDGVGEFKDNRKFVRDMGTNHLPHIYAELTHISYRLGEEPKPQPPIKFVD